MFLTWAPIGLGAIIVGGLGNWICLNKHMTPKNLLRDDRDYYMYLRDRRITGCEYYPKGLEDLDEAPKPKKRKTLWNW
ncbi:unnamed protein product [Didymodactylos carnosus]|uniref:NADH dehydrogenase [ubiquinone] 1 alpha subcomplex subunit 1 n=1 Tax=Didymodactylos carnosus TaxID=1234261 RepID=A0A813USJ7_9BILA|nr:unnamed protein product [Didymodactylos carnosus]CAF1058148.1 unnamed protein product [Didymodactylos carnosus]CAF3614014.1 unnamed protein product [Didymodactylos carnosus]CAF3824059.1 unnamed protein product [Didymodactylos carnosus]